jgi:hypothetical protein
LEIDFLERCLWEEGSVDKLVGKAATWEKLGLAEKCLCSEKY